MGGVDPPSLVWFSLFNHRGKTEIRGIAGSAGLTILERLIAIYQMTVWVSRYLCNFSKFLILKQKSGLTPHSDLPFVTILN